jgi:hypothetical protein
MRNTVLAWSSELRSDSKVLNHVYPGVASFLHKEKKCSGVPPPFPLVMFLFFQVPFPQ